MSLLEEPQRAYINEGELEQLARWTICQANFTGMSSNRDRDGKLNPLVDIIDPFNPSRTYMAEVISNRRTSRRGIESNAIRQRLIDSQFDTGHVYVEVLGYSDNLTPPYLVLATTEEPGDQNTFEMSSRHAIQVLRGEYVFYARYILEGNRGDPVLRAYRYVDRQATKLFGFLQAVKLASASALPQEEAVRYAENRITEEMIYGSDKLERLQPGDFLIARLTGTSRDGRTCFFEPVVNFEKNDGATTSDGDPLVTRVEGYQEGSLIYDLPILAQMESDREDRGMLGFGYVKRPEQDSGRFFYKPVVVKRGKTRKGGYIRQARILNNGEACILAENLDTSPLHPS